MLSPESIPSDWLTLRDRIQGLVWLNEHLDGQIGLLDGTMLYELARQHTGDVLELGTFRGKSTTFLARGLLDRRVPALEPGSDGCRVFTLDPHVPATGGNLSNLRWAQRVWWACGVSGAIVPQRTTLHDVLPTEQIRLVFVDDCHADDVLRRNLQIIRAAPSVETIVVHDVQWPHVRVPAHQELVETRQWESVDYWEERGPVASELFRRIIA